MEKLTNFRDDIKETVEGNEGKGYKPKPDVLKWIKDVCELEIEWKTMQESIATTRHLRIRVVQIAAFVQKSPLKHETSKINFADLKRSDKALDQIC
uniref:Putative ovule protein n=1 Tax=Solanum chacoense TaxID=4108 RepID=A0A0V0HKP2_SOLCH